MKLKKLTAMLLSAAMVAGLAYHYYAAGKFSDLTLDTFARLPHITEVPFRRRSA